MSHVASQFGQYEIRQEIGSGGMSTVYLAYDTIYKRDIALKVIAPHFLNDKNIKDRFLREAQVIAELDHFAIVPVYNFGEANGRPFIAMRFMSQGTLDDKIRAGTLTEQEIESILQRMCAALDYAHSKNIVHRDLKPGNILFDGGNMAHLTDFGIAHLMHSTQTRNLYGTPAYISPEQVQNQTVNARTDVYQLGIILYEMLTGHIPFSGDAAAMMYAHVYTSVPSVSQTVPYGNQRYQAAIHKATEKNPKDRFSSAGELYHFVVDGGTVLKPGSQPVSVKPPLVSPNSLIAKTTILVTQKIQAMSNKQLAVVSVTFTMILGAIAFFVGNIFRDAIHPIWEFFGSFYLLPAALSFELTKRKMAPLAVYVPIHIVVMVTSYPHAFEHLFGITFIGFLGGILMTIFSQWTNISRMAHYIICVVSTYLLTVVFFKVTGFFGNSGISLVALLGAVASGLLAYVLSEAFRGYKFAKSL